MTGLLHEKEFSRQQFIKAGGALIVGFSIAGAGLVAGHKRRTAPSRATDLLTRARSTRGS